MPEGPKKSNLPAAMQTTNWILGKLAKGTGALAKAGYEKVKEGRDKRFEEKAVNDIHEVMYGGVPHLPGHPRPAIRATALSPDELQKFTDAANGLTDRGIPLPGYVTSFASNFHITLKRPW